MVFAKKTILSTILIVALGLTSGLIACGSGGSSGGGGGIAPKTVIEGNVTEPTAALSRVRPTLFARLQKAFEIISEAAASVSGIQVQVRGTAISAVTDENGFFHLEGDISGPVILDFVLPDMTLSLGLDVPQGSTLSLDDITLNVSSGEATAGNTEVSANDNGSTAIDGNVEDNSGNDNPGDVNDGNDDGNDGPGHDIGDDNGNDGPGHDIGDDNGGDVNNGDDDTNDDHGGVSDGNDDGADDNGGASGDDDSESEDSGSDNSSNQGNA